MSKGVKIGIGIIVFLVIAIIILSVFMVSGDRIHSNITINGVNVGGMTPSQAETRLKDSFEAEVEKASIPLRFQSSKWAVSFRDLGFKYQYSEAVQTAYGIGHSGNYFKRVADTVRTQMNREDIKLGFTYDPAVITAKLSGIGKEIDRDAVDATIKMVDQSFSLTDEIEGRKLDQTKASDMIKNQVEKRETAEIELPVEILQPGIKRADLMNIKDKLGEYSTKFNAADSDRTHNIRIATNSASNVLVKPGETYSLNDTVGPRLEKFGFKEAKVIINNELVPGIGGGVCQVSSTLYNAALLSNMKIVERRSHSLPSSYIPMGRDATISEDYIDFKFENNTSYPIYIYGEVKGSWVKFSIYGRNDNPGRTVKIQTEIVKKTDPEIKIIQDPTLPEGTEVEEKKAYTGYVVKSYRIVVENGQQVSVEELPLSVYRVANGVKRIGTGKAPDPAAENALETQPVTQPVMQQ